MFLDLAARHAIDLAISTHVGDYPKDRAAAGIPHFVWAHDFFAFP